MIGGFEQAVPIQSITPLDTSLMQAYIAGVRELYNLARDDYKDFINKYDDFYSLSDVDNANYYNMTKGAAAKLIQQYGGDLLRSAEGRAAIQNMIAGVDKAAIANMKASAETMKEFVKNRDALAAQGKYDPRWDAFYSDMHDPEHWDSRKGVWTRTAPAEFQTLHDLTKDEFEKMKPTELLGTVKGPDGALYLKKGVSNATASEALAAVLRKKESIPGMLMYEDIIRKEVERDPRFSGMSKSLIEAEVQRRWMGQLMLELAMYLLPTYETSPAWDAALKIKASRASASGSGTKIGGRYSQGVMYQQSYGANMVGIKDQDKMDKVSQLYGAINQLMKQKGSKKDYFSETGIDMTTSEMMMYTGQEDKMYDNRFLLWDPSSIKVLSAKDLAYSTATSDNVRLTNSNGGLFYNMDNSNTAEINRIYLSFMDQNKDGKRMLVLAPVKDKGYINPTLANGTNVPFGKFKVMEVAKDEKGNLSIVSGDERTKAEYFGRKWIFWKDESDDYAVDRLNNLLPMIELLGSTDLNGNLLPNGAAAFTNADAKVTGSFNTNTDVHTGSVYPNVQ